MTDYEDVIAGFVDSEPVDAHALGHALARPEGRAYLIDLLVLRGLVIGSRMAHVAGGLQVAGRAANVAGGRVTNVAGGLQPAGSPKRSGRWLSVAALLTMGVTGGFLAGRLMFMRGPVHQVTDVRPPIEAVVPANSVAAPAPTHVIRMEKGVDWNERSGGN